MCLKGNRLEPEPFRINVQVLIGHEEEYILLGRPQFSQARKDNGLPEFEDLLHLRQEIDDNLRSSFLVHIIGLRIEIYQDIVRGVCFLPEAQTFIWGIDSVALIRK